MSTAVETGRGVEPRHARPLGRGLRRVGLALFFASVAVNAALGVAAVLTPDFGETQGKILTTSLCVTGAVLLGLACEPAWERGLLGPVPLAGAVLAAIGFGLVVAAIWAEPSGDTLGKLQSTVLAVAGAAVLASLLALAPLAPRRALLPKATLGLLALAATMFAVMPWLEGDPPEWFLRTFGVVTILLAAFVVTIPVLHWTDRRELAALQATTDVRFCPYCGAGVAGEPGGEAMCRRCGSRFVVVGGCPLDGDLT